MGKTVPDQIPGQSFFAVCTMLLKRPFNGPESTA